MICTLTHFVLNSHLPVHNILDDIPYIWTGGRKCNFNGCDRKDLMPNIVNGWFWAPTNKKIPAKNKCRVCDWSRTGGYVASFFIRRRSGFEHKYKPMRSLYKYFNINAINSSLFCK